MIESFVEQISSATKASNGNSRSPAGEGCRQADAPQRTGGNELRPVARHLRCAPLGRRPFPRPVRVRRLNCCRRRVPKRVPNSANLTPPPNRTQLKDKSPKQT